LRVVDAIIKLIDNCRRNWEGSAALLATSTPASTKVDHAVICNCT
jgi:hypothetical protein